MKTETSYKTKSLRTLLLWSLLFVFITPQFVQLLHQFDNNDHGHHLLHPKTNLQYQIPSEHCSIFNFVYSSFQQSNNETGVQALSFNLTSLIILPVKNILISFSFQLQLLRAPPIFI